MTRRYGIFLTLATWLLASRAFAFPDGIVVDEDGRMKVGGLDVAVVFFDHQWNRTTQNNQSVVPDGGYPHVSDKQYELKGLLKLGNFPPGFAFQQWVREESPDTVSYSMNMRHADGARANVLCLNLDLPTKNFSGKVVKVNGREILLADDAAHNYPPVYKVQTVEIIHGDKTVTVTGSFTLQIQDNRRYKVPTYSLRMMFGSANGLIRESAFKGKFSVKPFAIQSLDLAAPDGAAGLAGDAAAKLVARYNVRTANPSVGGIPFVTADPKAKTGGALSVAAGKTAAVAVREPAEAGRYLYLLHNATVPGARPSIKADFGDGVQTLSLAADKDFAVAKPLRRIPNGAVAASHNATLEGLYFSVFPLERAGVKSLGFANDGDGEWNIVAATLSDTAVRVAGVDSVYYVIPDDTWMPMAPAAAVKPGSVLDFSGRIDAPAGKRGWIKVDAAGHFTAGGQRVKLYGPNLCFSAQYLEKPEAEALADELARYGYTSVRFHHFDRDLSQNPKDSTDLDPERLDKLDYLFHCLKERGLYITIDVYCSRTVREGEIPEIPGFKGRALKAAAPIHPAARANWKTFARKLLARKNPYTGMIWAEDPALFGLSLLNENNIYSFWRNETVGQLYLDGYARYLKEKNLDTPENRASRGGVFLEYLNSVHVDMIKDFTGFLRDELKYGGLVTDFNFHSYVVQSDIRKELDFVDNHTYWDHPHFLPSRPWSAPFIHNQNSALKANIVVPRMLFGARQFGKPYTITEVNYVFPNRFRAESGPLMGAYAALQDWDGLYRFAWAHRRDAVLRKEPIQQFDIVRDPVSLVAERITGLMFVRGDVSPAKGAVAFPFGPGSYKNLADIGGSNYPQSFEELGLFCRVGSLPEGASFPGTVAMKSPGDLAAVTTDAMRTALNGPAKTSETGEIVYNGNAGTFVVASPRTESLTLSKGDLSGKALSVRGADVFQAVTACSLDERPLAESSGLLVFHQTDATNERIRFSSESMNAVEHWGNTTTLIRKAKIEVSLKLSGKAYTVQVVGLDGAPKGTVPSTFTNGVLTFTADTAQYEGAMIYHITKQP